MARDFGGGMENISATTQIDNMIHDARTELDQTSDGLQSHELAHQWFGDYLTCAPGTQALERSDFNLAVASAEARLASETPGGWHCLRNKLRKQKLALLSRV